MPPQATNITREQRIRHLAEWIKRKELTAPAILFLHTSEPLALLGSQLLYACTPLLDFVGPIFGWPKSEPAWAEYAALLEDPACIDRILTCLEQ